MIGTQLGHFRITAKLGEGGMGEVYRAEDTKLGREVAIKVLPEAVTRDPERRARFEREAKLLAALNHPNIAGIYEVGEAPVGRDGGAASAPATYLVMELAEGETLAERIARGPLALEEAIPLALQIARALEAAHARGVIHRDLKPANLKIAADGTVKVLDFGLAKALAASHGSEDPADVTHSPTITAHMTVAGVILGTAAYMSPEQAKGEEADKRSDIWSFGVVLAEMLGGRRPFEDSTASETLASVLKSAPDLSRLPAGLPPPLLRLIDRCLRKDPDERLHDIADARLALEDVAEGRFVAAEIGGTPRRRGLRPAAAAALVAAGVAVGLAAGALLPGGGEELRDIPPRRFTIEHGDLRASDPKLSPDGHRLAYVHHGRIWIRDLRRLETLPVAGGEDGISPFWSPDGAWLGFFAQDTMWKIRLDGSSRTSVTAVPNFGSAGGAAWLPDGRIVFTTGSSALLEVSERGGESRTLVELAEGEADFHLAEPIPGADAVLTIVHRGDTFDNIQLVRPSTGEREELLTLPGQSVQAVAWSPTGHLVFERWPAVGLWALPFDPESLRPTGEPFLVLRGGGRPTTADGGALAYVTRLPRVEAEIVLVDRNGRTVERIGEPVLGLYSSPALSPDGRRVVAPVLGNQGFDLWEIALDASAPRRLTFLDLQSVIVPTFTPDGRELFLSLWRSTSDYGVYRMPAGGGEPRRAVGGIGPPAFTRDGSEMVYMSHPGGFNWDLWRRPTNGDEPGTPLVTGDGWDLYPALSPDDRLLAYTHAGQLLVRTYPDGGGPFQVGPGTTPRWSPDGSRLYYVNGNDMMETRLLPGDTLRFTPPERLFTFDFAPTQDDNWPTFDLTPDGEAFVMVRGLEDPPGLVYVQNWPAALE